MNPDKIELIEDFSSYFENIYNFPPLTSKIYSYLILDTKREGITFDELVETFNASKSSVSNSLNFLSQLNYVEYFSKIDHRKRFYRVAPESMLVRLKRVSTILQHEKQLTCKFMNYLSESSEDGEANRVLKSEIYIKHLDSSIAQLENTIKKLESITD